MSYAKDGLLLKIYRHAIGIGHCWFMVRRAALGVSVSGRGRCIAIGFSHVGCAAGHPGVRLGDQFCPVWGLFSPFFHFIVFTGGGQAGERFSFHPGLGVFDFCLFFQFYVIIKFDLLLWFFLLRAICGFVGITILQ